MGDVEKRSFLEENGDDMAPKEGFSYPALSHRGLSRKAIFFRVLACVGLVGFAFHAVRGFARRRNILRHPQVAANPDSRGRLTVQEAERRFL